MSKKVASFLFALILFPLIAWSGGKGDLTPKAVQDRYLVPGVVFEKSFDDFFLFTAKKRGRSGFEALKRSLESKGLVFEEWDRQRAKEAREAARGRRRGSEEKSGEEGESPADPLDIEGYRSAAAVKEGALIIISSHLFDPASGKWIEWANVQVNIFHKETSTKSPSPRPVPDGTGPRLPGRSR